MQRILDEHCHHMPAEEVLGILGVDPAKGLDLFEVDHRRERFGPNLLKERKGRNPVLQFLLQFHQPLVYVLLASALLCAGAFAIFEWLLSRGSAVAEARTGAVAIIVFGELFYLFNCRSLRRSFLSTGLFSNPYLWLGSGLMVVLQIAFTDMPLMNRLFGSQPLDGPAWLLVLAFSVLVPIVVGTEKFSRGKLSGRSR
jgi:cation-transporting P-type ATPase F